MSDASENSSRTSELPFLSPAEWRVFSLLAKKGPLTVRQLVSELETTSEETRSYTTVLTLAQRLTAKGYVAPSEKAAPRGPASVITFSPSIPYPEALRRHVERFLSQYTLGAPDDLRLVGEVLGEHLASH